MSADDAYRMRRLRQLFEAIHPRGWQAVEDVMAADSFRRNPELRKQYIDGLFVSWFGYRPPRCDKGTPRGWQEQVYEHACRSCGQWFKTSRPDSRTCSARCRQRLHRRHSSVTGGGSR